MKIKLIFWNEDMKYVVEPGSFTIMIGTSSADIKKRIEYHHLWKTIFA